MMYVKIIIEFNIIFMNINQLFFLKFKRNICIIDLFVVYSKKLNILLKYCIIIYFYDINK